MSLYALPPSYQETWLRWEAKCFICYLKVSSDSVILVSKALGEPGLRAISEGTVSTPNHTEREQGHEESSHYCQQSSVQTAEEPVELGPAERTYAGLCPQARASLAAPG